MVLLALAASGAAGGAGMNMINYNRDGWMTDVQVNQNRRYQRQQVRLMQAEMFREDIRDLVGAAVSKQNNFVLVATLVLGMIVECYVEGPMPEGAAEYVETAYFLCVGSSFVYLVLSVLCAVTATNLASDCQKDLLTTLVRLPVDEFVAEINQAAIRESSEAFEHQHLTKMFRVPGLGRLKGEAPVPADQVRMASTLGETEDNSMRGDISTVSNVHSVISTNFRDERSQRSTRSGSVSSRSRPAVVDRARTRSLPPPMLNSRSGSSSQSIGSGDVRLRVQEEGDLGIVEPQADKAARHLNVFTEKEVEWSVIARCAFVFGALGASNLLQAYGYFAAAKFYTGSYWASGVVQFLVVLVNAISARAYLEDFPAVGNFGALLNIVAPGACHLSMRVEQPGWIDQVCIPLCFVCHFLWNCLGCWHISIIVRRASKQRMLEKEMTFSSAASGRWKPSAEQATEEDVKDSPLPPDRGKTRSTQRQKRFTMVFAGSGIVVVSWFITVIWAVVYAARGDADDGMVPKSVNIRKLHLPGEGPVGQQRRLTFAVAPRPPAAAAEQATVVELSVAWPNRRFRPHSIACDSKQTCFVANDFLVYQFDFSSAEQAVPRPIACNISGTILDVAAACSGDGHCRPLVLVRQQGRADVFECGEQHGEPLPVNADGNLDRIAAGRDSGLLTLQGKRVVQHEVVPSGRGWRPLWPLAETVQDDVVALDFVGAGGSFVLFSATGTMSVVDVDLGVPCHRWAWTTIGEDVVTGAAVINAGTALLALHRIGGRVAGDVRLMRVAVPGLPAACSKNHSTAASQLRGSGTTAASGGR